MGFQKCFNCPMSWALCFQRIPFCWNAICKALFLRLFFWQVWGRSWWVQWSMQCIFRGVQYDVWRYLAKQCLLYFWQCPDNFNSKLNQYGIYYTEWFSHDWPLCVSFSPNQTTESTTSTSTTTVSFLEGKEFHYCYLHCTFSQLNCS